MNVLFIYAVSVSQPLFDVFGRFLVHRYSVLQQHAEANGIDGVDDLDTLEVGKTHYHDDSDEVHTAKATIFHFNKVIELILSFYFGHL